MEVIKRDGSREPVDFNKVQRRVELMAKASKRQLKVDVVEVAKKTIAGIIDGITTKELDQLACEVSVNMVLHHPDYGQLAGNIAMSNLHKTTPKTFSEFVFLAYNHKTASHQHVPLVTEAFYKYVQENAEALNGMVNNSLDFEFDYFGYKTLERSYLIRTWDKRIIERVGYMYLRVAVHLFGVNGNDLGKVAACYKAMHSKLYTHATPTLFNAGTNNSQLASCFLLDLESDSIDGIYETISRTARISKLAGGIGVSVSKIRSSGSYIKGTGGYSNGLVPALRVLNETARYVDQGGGKRKGAFAVYLEPWHADVEDFLQLRKNHGNEHQRCRDLFTALWVPDLFMKRVEEDATWSLFSPSDVPELTETYGSDFEYYYTKAEKEGYAIKTLPARQLMRQIVEAQQETGAPYMLYKDTINKRNNQKASGNIRSSNLCAEIVEVTEPDEIAVCNLASINLGQHVTNDPTPTVDWYALAATVRLAVEALNKVIDVNKTPIPELMQGNSKLRPIGLGVQGLADLFHKLGIAYESDQAKELNTNIFRHIYEQALHKSTELVETGVYPPYEGFQDSPLAKGILQPDYTPKKGKLISDKVRERARTKGCANSLLIALMPTASTSQIFGATESFEPVTSNIYSRRALAGDFIQVNANLVAELEKIGMWTPTVVEHIKANKGSIQNVPGIPVRLKSIYKTVWEMSMRTYIDMAADRQAFICQSQSMNLYLANPDESKMASMHMYAWKAGLKTGMYYFRTQAAAAPIAFTLDQSKLAEIPASEGAACNLDDPDCLACSA